MDEPQETTSPSNSTPPTPEVTPEAVYKRQVRLIHKARKLRKDWENKYKVKDCERFYLGDQGLEDGVRVLNHFLATIRVTQPNLLYENPKFLARTRPGKQPVSQRTASIAESVLENVAKQDDNLTNAAGLALLQNFFRIAVLKACYNPKLEPNPSAGEPMYQYDAAGEVMHDPETGMPMPEMDMMTGQPLVEPDFIISDEVYYWEWVDARRMLLPDEGPDQCKWTWIGEEVVIQLEDALEDERFNPTLRQLLKSNETRHNKNDGEAGDSRKDDCDPEDQMLRYVECYDLKKKRWYCIAEGQDFQEPLLDEPLPDGIEDHPYAIMAGWVPIVGPEPSSWPLPFTQPWLDPQSEYNLRRNQKMNAAKHAARKVLYTPATFESPEEALKMLQSSTDMEGVKIADMTQKPEILTDPSSNPDIDADTAYLLADYRFISGQTAAKAGAAGGADTATEASFMERASNLRDAELQKAVNRWLKTAGKKMWQRIKNTLTLDLWVTLRGMDDKEVDAYFERHYGVPAQVLEMVPQVKQMMIAQHGQDRPLKVDRETLNFEVDIDVVPGSTRPRTLASEKAEFLEFLQLFAQFPQIALSKSLMQELAKKYEFIEQGTVEELQLLAQTLVMLNQSQAGRNQGGEGGSPENTEGQGNSDGTQRKAAAHRGASVES